MPHEFRLVVFFAAPLFDARYNSVDPITGGYQTGRLGVFMIPDEIRPSLMFYTASSVSFCSAFHYPRSHFRYSRISLDVLSKKYRLLVVY